MKKAKILTNIFDYNDSGKFIVFKKEEIVIWDEFAEGWKSNSVSDYVCDLMKTEIVILEGEAENG